MGDISADGRSVQAARVVLGINDEALLCYGTQLQTSEEPYGWTFLNVQISSSDNVERLQQEMKQLGCPHRSNGQSGLCQLCVLCGWNRKFGWKYNIDGNGSRCGCDGRTVGEGNVTDTGRIAEISGIDKVT